MAITVLQEPDVVSPAYNDLAHVVSSSNVSQDNFKFICDIYVNGSSSYVSRIATPPHPTLGTAVFNPARIIESYVSKDFDVNNVASFKADNSTAYYVLKFGEEYGLSSSGTTIYPDMTVTSTKYVFNGVFDWEDWCGYDYTKYISGGASSQWLTNAPNNKLVYIDSNYSSGNEFIYGINASSGSIYYMDVDTFDSAGSQLGSYRIINNFQALSSSDEKMVGFPCGVNIDNITTGDIQVVSGTLPIITASVDTYTVDASNFASDKTITTAKTFKIERSCSKHPLYEIYFLNKLGGYDTFVFHKKSTWRTSIKRDEYKTNLGVHDGSNTFTSTVNQRGITQFNTVLEDAITLRSDYVDEATITWLEELVTSPDVYMLRSGEHVPIVITSSSFERKQTVSDKIFNLTIEVKFSYKRNRQRF